MPPEFINKINWLDVVIFLIFLRTLAIGIKRGVIIEFFKLLGLLVSIVISFHYFSRLGNFLNSKSPLPLEFADFVSLIFISSLLILLFKFIRDGITVLVKTEVKPAADKWLGFILSVLRAFVLSSLILIILFCTNIAYIKASVKNSFSQGYILNIAPRLYSGCFESLFVKFFPSEQLNTAIFELLEPKEKEQS